MSRYPTTLPRQSRTGGALFASPVLSESTNASMFVRSASMIGAMLPVTSIKKTTSATPLVFARAWGAALGAAGSVGAVGTAGASTSGAESPGVLVSGASAPSAGVANCSVADADSSRVIEVASSGTEYSSGAADSSSRGALRSGWSLAVIGSLRSVVAKVRTQHTQPRP